jgi:hypothetical protein
MKEFKLILIGLGIFFSYAIKAQVSVNVNIGAPPMWGPVGYPEVQYYYLPDVEAYYDVHTSMFIYFGGGVWLHEPRLPGIYANYDLYSGYKVVLSDYHGSTPYVNFHDHKKKYYKGYKGGSQKTIGQKPGKGNSNSKSSGKSGSGNQGKQSHDSQGGKKSGSQGGNNKSGTQGGGNKQGGDHQGGGHQNKGGSGEGHSGGGKKK